MPDRNTKLGKPLSSLKSSIALLLAEFFYCGRAPFAPGTVGSLGALIIWIPALYYRWPAWLLLLILLFLFLVGLWACPYGIAHYQNSDPKQVVIDEVVGVGIPFLVIDPNWIEILAAFVLFRFFDILKPWPIKAVEKRFLGGMGIMLDDVVAGIFALLVIVLAKLLLSSL
jgi:phosphatidylglycerophosphatase A